MSSLDTACTGTRAILATIFSMSATVDFKRLRLPAARLAAPRRKFLRRAGLVDHVDRLVGQMQILQMPRRQRHRGFEGLVRIGHAVMRFVGALQALENLDRLGFRRLEHLDLLEAARQRAILVERLLHVGERRRPDAAQRARRQRRLQQVAGIHRAARRRAGADQRVNLVDEEDGVRRACRARRAPA